MPYNIFSKKSCQGLTLIEILVAIAILGFISMITYEALFTTNQKEILEKEVSRVSAIIERARSYTLSSLNDSAYGIHIEEDRLVTFSGDSYDVGDPDNKIDILNKNVSIIEHNLSGGGDDILFERLTGKTDQNGTLNIALTNATTTFYTITVHETGLVDVE